MNLLTHTIPPRKRLKVVRACTECRRKKTKCDNELPCAPCRKSCSDCEYLTKFGPRSTSKPRQSIKPDDMASPNLSTLATNRSMDDTDSRAHTHSSPRRPLTYTIQAIEHRLLEIEKILGLLLQRHYPSLPPLVLSPPSSSTSSTTSKTHYTDRTDIQTLDFGSRDMKHPISPRNNRLVLPPLQTKPTPPLSHHVDMTLIPGSSICDPLLDRKILGLPSLLQPDCPFDPLATYHPIKSPTCIP